MTPARLAIAGVVCFLLFLGALQSEEGGDGNMLTPILALAWPLLLVAAAVWAIAARVRRSR